MAQVPLPESRTLKRDVGLFGAVALGLGSILGTGVFVSLGVAAGIAGPAVTLAVVIAAIVALCNALSSAQLAAAHPVSGGTYEYGYRHLHPSLGFTAGWMFLCAKTASGATAALGFAGYFLRTVEGPEWATVPLASGAAILLTLFVWGGVKRSNSLNVLTVSITLAALVAFSVAGFRDASPGHFSPFFGEAHTPFERTRALLHATALMFVAYTGYGRLATMGEEVLEPRKTIPRAIVATLVVSALLYSAVALAAIASAGAPDFGAAAVGPAAPLEVVARGFSTPGVRRFVALGAMTAMLGVLLNLVLGLSRVWLAMGRRGDMPRALSLLNHSQTTPIVAVPVAGLAIAGLALLGSVKTTWAFSAFTVLVYYAITNLAALRLSKEERLYSPVFAWLGLAACLFLAFWVDWKIWAAGLCLLVFGLAWHLVARRFAIAT